MHESRRASDRLVRHALGVCAALGALAGVAHAQTIVQVFPTAPIAVIPNNVPWLVGVPSGVTMHQVFASALFSAATQGAPARIERLTFSGMVTGHVTLRLGYTHAIPGAPACGGGGLAIPDPAGGGAPNAIAPMATFFDADVTDWGVGPSDLAMIYDGQPFVYDPALGNLLVEVHMPVRTAGTFSLTTGLTLESSRTYQVHGGGASSTALQAVVAGPIEFTFSPVSVCYANCDGSTAEPTLNVLDFNCFLNQFSAGAPYANCDGSTVEPVLNVLDFNCFLNRFAGGCP
jgi:hypothetical protein